MKYKVIVSCLHSQVIEVEAKNEEEAMIVAGDAELPDELGEFVKYEYDLAAPNRKHAIVLVRGGK